MSSPRRYPISRPARLDDDLVVLSDVEQVRAASVRHSSASHARGRMIWPMRTVTAAFLARRPAEAPAARVGRDVRAAQQEGRLRCWTLTASTT